MFTSGSLGKMGVLRKGSQKSGQFARAFHRHARRGVESPDDPPLWASASQEAILGVSGVAEVKSYRLPTAGVSWGR